MKRGAWIVVALWVFGASASRAQAPSETPVVDNREAARQAYTRGEQMFRNGNFVEAESAFEEAYRLIPNPVVLKSLGESRERQGDLPGALAAFELYLVGRQDAPDRVTIEARLVRIRAQVATISVVSDPPGASIRVDEELREEVTPADIVVMPGEHAVTLELAGYETSANHVSAVAGARAEVMATLGEVPPTPDPEPVAEPSVETDMPLVEPDEPEPTEGGGVSAGVWVCTAVAGVGLITGSVLGFMALSEQSSFDENPTQDTADSGERLALFADLAFGFAAAGAITAIILYATSDSPADDENEEDAEPESAELRVLPFVAPDGGGVSGLVRF